MQQASSAADFLANPMGRYYAGRRHCVFAHSPTLLGFATWGRPDVDDLSELLRGCAIGLEPRVPYRWLVDNRGLELIQPATFALFVEYTRKHRETLGRNIERQAQLRPDGVVGAIMAGFGHLARLPYPDRVFGDVEEALTWLPIDPEEGVPLLAELDAIRSGGSDVQGPVVRLRRHLDTRGVMPADEAARVLGLSTRSLQRALRNAGTTYRLELRSFRIRRAQELLRQGEESLAWVAAELGFSSAQHFSTAYRRAVGETPGSWRARHRVLDDADARS